jgi:Flp pilus assembly pilin Flp
MHADMSGLVRGCPGERSGTGEGSRPAPIGTHDGSTHDKGAVATEFVLVTSLIAAVAVGLMAALGTWVGQPLTALVSALGGLTGVN